MKKAMHRRPSHRAKQPPVLQGAYNRHGYEVWMDGRLAYSAGNHVHDSTQPAMSEEDLLPLRTIRQFCHRTTREITAERRGVFAGVERVAEEAPESGQEPL